MSTNKGFATAKFRLAERDGGSVVQLVQLTRRAPGTTLMLGTSCLRSHARIDLPCVCSGYARVRAQRPLGLGASF